MAWWRSSTPHYRTDREIARYVLGEVKAGRVLAEHAQHLERTLRDERDGRAIIMRNPGIKPRPPRRPGTQSQHHSTKSLRDSPLRRSA